MKVAVTGAGGLVGTTLVPLFREAGAEVTAWTRRDLDVTDGEAVQRTIRALGPDVVVHAAAWTDVDGAEANPAEAMRVNREGTAAVASACAAVGSTLVALGSDYIFDGAARAPIPAGAPARPLGAYARSKAAGEAAVRAAAGAFLIVRTGWVYGPGGRNFVDTMRTAAAERRVVRVVEDQVGAPTSSRLLAEAIWGLVALRATGIWHAAAGGETSWHGVARTVYAAAGAPVSLVHACSSAEFARPAPRPAYSVLDCDETSAALGVPMPGWEEQVRAYARSGVLLPCGLMRAVA